MAEEIKVIGLAESGKQNIQAKRLGDSSKMQQWALEMGNVGAEALAEQLTGFYETITGVLENITCKASNYELTEIEISVVLSAEGQIKLLGAVGAGIDGGITMKFAKK